EWAVIGPGPAGSYSLEDLPVAQDPGDPGHRKAGKRLTPNVEGSWDVQVIARDPEGGSTLQQLTPFTGVADHPPSLAQSLAAAPHAARAAPADPHPPLLQRPPVNPPPPPLPADPHGPAASVRVVDPAAGRDPARGPGRRHQQRLRARSRRVHTGRRRRAA